MKQKRAESRARYFVREQAKKRGWNTNHISNGGSFLEEQEITDYYKDIGLGLTRPDFVVCIGGLPVLVIETKNESNKIDSALSEAIEYCETINRESRYSVCIAIGVAGEENTGYAIEVRFKKDLNWIPLTSRDFEITTIPSKMEIEAALSAADGTTDVQVPSVSEFIESAIELSKILRLAKVEAPLRPKVIGALTLAMYQGNIDTSRERPLESINSLLSQAINESVDLSEQKKLTLTEALTLQGADYDRLSPQIARIVHLLRGLNIKAVLQTDTDFLGLFYEAFLRYGYDNNALGIVFTPRHITRFCVDLADVSTTDMVIDLACGTGGFLVSAFDKMFNLAHGPEAIAKVKGALYGFDTNPTIWALSTLNMFFRGDGKSHIEKKSCLDPDSRELVANKFSRSFLNPPFSQEGEPERDFIDASMNSLIPDGIFVCIVKAGIFADDDNANWRKEFTRHHTVLGMISMPDDLFYPTAAPTTIMIAKAHIPHPHDKKVFMSRIWNDGYEKLKGKRVECSGSQLPSTLDSFHKFMKHERFEIENAVLIDSNSILNGNEWSPQQWLPQVINAEEQLKTFERDVRISIYKAITAIPELAENALDNFTSCWAQFPALEYGITKPVSYFFDVLNGKSDGEKNYRDGDYPYISSGDSSNSIIKLAESDQEEVFTDGGITVTAFGQAYIQPWPFIARGNGGSAVRVLRPKYKMGFEELLWFAAQINSQKWRFFYARMSIKSRLERLEISSPNSELRKEVKSIKASALEFKRKLLELSGI